MSLFHYDNLKSLWINQRQPIFKTLNNEVTWVDFDTKIKRISGELIDSSNDTYKLFTEEVDNFLILFFALLYAGKNIVLSGVMPTHSDIPILCDRDINILGEGREFVNSLNYDSQFISLETSGSSGESKCSKKSLKLIENEINILSKHWAKNIEGAIFYSTVSHQHFYGLLFSALLPFLNSNTIYSKRIHYPEALFTLKNKKTCLISSPAFFKRLNTLDKELEIMANNLSLFSSGGFLPQSTAQYCVDYLGSSVHEIYGSTETGGIAYKISPKETFWTPFPLVTFNNSNKDSCFVKSSYIEEDFLLSDKLEFQADGSFVLIGRTDSVVKVEEKRVSLNEIENKLLESGLVTDAVVILMKTSREFISVAIELNSDGLTKFRTVDKNKINQYFRRYLKEFFHSTVIPKKWRYLEKLPRNSQGKISKELIMELFNPVATEVTLKSYNKKDNELNYIISYPENYIHFDGHFPELKILPAVAQVDWVINQASEKLDVLPYIKKMPRLKFSNPIFPNRDIDVNILYNEDKKNITFKYSDTQNGNTYSSGKVYLGDENEL